MTPGPVVAFVPIHNSPGKVDATGAFQPEARAMYKSLAPFGFSGVPTRIDNLLPRGRMRDIQVQLLAMHGDASLAAAVWFCHGYKAGLQLGWSTGTVDPLAAMLAQKLQPHAPVVLYACDTARDADAQQDDDLVPGPGGEGGFADLLRDALVRFGWRGHVDAHPVAAHTTWNPYVRRFEASGASDFIVDPGSELWSKWRKAVRHTEFRFVFPYLSRDEIERDLRALP